MYQETIWPRARPRRFRKYPGAMLFMIEIARGGVIFDAELAVRLGELLCEAHYGKDELERQRPLTAVDKGTYWRVEGSWNRDRRIDGPTTFCLSVQKYDCRLTDIGLGWAYRAHPSVIPIIEPYLRARKPEKPE